MLLRIVVTFAALVVVVVVVAVEKEVGEEGNVAGGGLGGGSAEEVEVRLTLLDSNVSHIAIHTICPIYYVYTYIYIV